jgi:hypothetical protein
MALKWNTVSAEHVKAALKQVSAMTSSNRTSGLVIYDGNRTLRAKDVLRAAYRLANHLSNDSPLKFSSGDGTLNVLGNLGFKVERKAK